MDRPLSVLVVSPSAADAAPLLEQLRSAGRGVDWEIGRSAAELEAAARRGCELVLACGGVEDFPPDAARETLRDLGAEVAFLEVTNTECPESAESDVVSLARLALRVEREVARMRIRRERRAAGRTLRESEGRFRAVAENALEAMLGVDEDDRVVFANAAAARVFGHPVTAMIGRPVERLLTDLPRPEDLAAEAVTGRPSVLERFGRHAAGWEIPLELSITQQPHGDRRLRMIVARDVSERKRAEAALRESEERFRVAAQISTDVIYEWNVAMGTVLVLHKREAHQSAHAIPRTREEWERLLHPEDRSRVLAAVHRALQTGGAFHEEYRIVLPDGAVRVRRGHGIVLRDEQGVPSKWIGVNKDVTERRRTQAALQESEQKLRTLVTNAPVILFALDRNGTFIHSEGRGLEPLGLKPGEVVGRTVWDVYGKHPHILEHVRRALAGDEHTAIVPVGHRAFETRYALYRDSSGAVAGVIGVATDVTEQVRVEHALRASEARYRKLFERNLAGVFRSTMDGRIVDCNDSFARIFGYDSPAEVLAQPALQFYLRPEDRTAFLQRIRERHTLSNHEMSGRRRDGTPIWILENATLLEDAEGSEVIEGTIIDITERKRAEEQVKHLAFHDALSGLPNRLLLNDRLRVALAQAHRSHQRLAVFYLDLDRFKVINDSLGHTTGDELLRRVADRLRSCVREEDTVARIGGDEFVILVPRLTAASDAETVARKILASIRLPFAVDERDFFLTTSLGVAVYPGDGIDVETLLQNADIAMYRAKEQGRDNFQLYAPSMNARAAERLSLENRLRLAIRNGELLLYYQPIVDLRDGSVRRAEALLRWRHPERGVLEPAEFISLAEVCGLIVPIGRWVLETVCAQLRQWRALGDPYLIVSLNLSARQFQQGDLVAQVGSALKGSGLDPGCLDLEITESSALDNGELTLDALRALRRLGVGISLDDFGTGYSSLTYLKKFPIDRVKLDRSFVGNVVTNAEDAAIVRAIIAMAHALDLVVVAEGVENAEQLAFLREQGCDEMQGFLFSPPVEASEFRTLLLRRPLLPATA